jgi:hypothetical protein
MSGVTGYLTVVFACLFVHRAWSIPLSKATLIPRVQLGDPLYNTGAYCDASGPDIDITGLGVRIGLYLQSVALVLASCTGRSETLAAIPASLMTALVYNIILSMKASEAVFQSNPVVQDFWVAQGQLLLLTTTLPLLMLFGKWKNLGTTKNVLLATTILYTYIQSFWFWLSGYKDSDEVVCRTLESSLLGRYDLFSQHAKYALVAMYIAGTIIVLLAIPNYIRGKEGIFSPLIRRIPTRLYYVKAVVLYCICIPFYLILVVMVEDTVRRGSQYLWLKSTGQWLALGLGVSTLIEAIWHTLRCIWRELHGRKFSDSTEVLGGEPNDYTKVER